MVFNMLGCSAKCTIFGFSNNMLINSMEVQIKNVFLPLVFLKNNFIHGKYLKAAAYEIQTILTD
jgi:hypothetical protein